MLRAEGPGPDGVQNRSHSADSGQNWVGFEVALSVRRGRATPCEGHHAKSGGSKFRCITPKCEFGERCSICSGGDYVSSDDKRIDLHRCGGWPAATVVAYAKGIRQRMAILH